MLGVAVRDRIDGPSHDNAFEVLAVLARGLEEFKVADSFLLAFYTHDRSEKERESSGIEEQS
jgi:hypothetical protein